jgi:hypothetical protein
MRKAARGGYLFTRQRERQLSITDLRAAHHLAAIRRIMVIGWRGWLAEELASPSWDDPAWREWTAGQYDLAGRPTAASIAQEF